MQQVQIKQENYIKEELQKCMERVAKKQEYIFICIGVDKITGDCFGPIVGTKLKEKLKNKNIMNISVYGDLENNITLSNIEEYKRKLEKRHKDACMIVIDAALSKKENIENIYITNKPTVLGKGLCKEHMQIGDISIKAVVGKDYKIAKYNFQILQYISLDFILILAEQLTEEIIEYIEFH